MFQLKKIFNKEKELILYFLKENIIKVKDFIKGTLVLIGIAAFIAIIYMLFKSLPLNLFPQNNGILTIILIISILLMIGELNKLKKENEKLRDELEEIKGENNYFDDDED